MAMTAMLVLVLRWRSSARPKVKADIRWRRGSADTGSADASVITIVILQPSPRRPPPSTVLPRSRLVRRPRRRVRRRRVWSGPRVWRRRSRVVRPCPCRPFARRRSRLVGLVVVLVVPRHSHKGLGNVVMIQQLARFANVSASRYIGIAAPAVATSAQMQGVTLAAVAARMANVAQ